MEDYMNMYLRRRTVKVDGKYYSSFSEANSKLSKEETISVEKIHPPPETEIMTKGHGVARYTAVRRREAKVKIPFMPPTFETIQKNNINFLSPVWVMTITRADSKGVPAADTFFVLTCIEAKEVKEPKAVEIT